MAGGRAHVTLTAADQATQVLNAVLGKYQAADFRLFGQPDPDADYYWWTSTSVGAADDISLNIPRFATPQTDAALRPAEPPPTRPSATPATSSSSALKNTACPTSGWPAPTG